MDIFIIGAICYLMGSLPFGFILTKIFLKKDIREIGSGNIGATNALRTGSKFIGYTTLFFDIIKAVIPIIYIKLNFPEFLYIASLCAFLGHVFPIWLRFKGGKGVASFMAFTLVTSWPFFITFSITWLITVKLCKYSSLAAISSIIINVIIFKLILQLQFNNNLLLWIPGEPIEFQFTLLLSIVILCKHYSNITSMFRK